MAITATNSTAESRAFSIGPVKMQMMTYRALSGATSGTVTADGLSSISHIQVLSGRLQHTAAPTMSANVATLAFAVPAETAASLIVQDLTYTAVADLGQDANAITIAYVAGGTTGAEVVTVTGNAISVSMHTAVSTATQIKAAIDASAAALALISVAVTGTGSTAQVAATATALAGGVSGGGRGTLLCIGR